MAFTPYRSPWQSNPQAMENHIARLKKQIGYSEEPVLDHQGYWTIGYGQRLNDTPGGPQPYAGISQQSAEDELRYFVEQGGDANARIKPAQHTFGASSFANMGDREISPFASANSNQASGLNRNYFLADESENPDEPQPPPAEEDPAQPNESDPDPSNGMCPHGSKVMRMEVTAYTNGPESTQKRPGHPGYGITKSGKKAGPGTIAAPIEYMDRRMYVPGYGWGTVQDTGGAIKGNRLDVWFESVDEARRWGRQMLDVIVCNG